MAKKPKNEAGKPMAVSGGSNETRLPDFSFRPDVIAIVGPFDMPDPALKNMATDLAKRIVTEFGSVKVTSFGSLVFSLPDEVAIADAAKSGTEPILWVQEDPAFGYDGLSEVSDVELVRIRNADLVVAICSEPNFLVSSAIIRRLDDRKPLYVFVPLVTNTSFLASRIRVCRETYLGGKDRGRIEVPLPMEFVSVDQIHKKVRAWILAQQEMRAVILACRALDKEKRNKTAEKFNEENN